MRFLTLIFTFLICAMPITRLFAAGGVQVSSEQQAYEKILQYFLARRYEAEKPSEIVWDENIKALMESSSPDGDKYLVNLGFVGFDAHASESYSCAVDIRMGNHREALKKQLKLSLTNFDQQNPCEQFNKTKAKGHKILVCKSKEDFTRFANSWLTKPEQPDAEAEVDCTEFF